MRGGIWAYERNRTAHVVSAPSTWEGGAARLVVSVEGIAEHSSIAPEIQDHAFRSILGYDRGASQCLGGSGLAQPIIWAGP